MAKYLFLYRGPATPMEAFTPEQNPSGVDARGVARMRLVVGEDGAGARRLSGRDQLVAAAQCRPDRGCVAREETVRLDGVRSRGARHAATGQSCVDLVRCGIEKSSTGARSRTHAGAPWTTVTMSSTAAECSASGG